MRHRPTLVSIPTLASVLQIIGRIMQQKGVADHGQAYHKKAGVSLRQSGVCRRSWSVSLPFTLFLFPAAAARAVAARRCAFSSPAAAAYRRFFPPFCPRGRQRGLHLLRIRSAASRAQRIGARTGSHAHPRFIFSKPRMGQVFSVHEPREYGAAECAARASAALCAAPATAQPLSPTQQLGAPLCAFCFRPSHSLQPLPPLRGIFRNQLAARRVFVVLRWPLSRSASAAGFPHAGSARDRYLFPIGFFDIRKDTAARSGHRTKPPSLLSGAARAANAVDIRFGNIGQLEIDHKRRLVDIDAAPQYRSRPAPQSCRP